MRYMIDEQDTDERTSIALYRTTLNWAASHCDHLVMNIKRDDYDDPQELARLCALGHVASSPRPEGPVDQIQKIISEVFRASPDMVQVIGVPDERFVRELTDNSAPTRAVSGDASPVQDVMMLSDDRILYACYDYGRTQILDLTDEELQSLDHSLKEAGLDPAHLIPAPPYLTDSKD